jgi:hypothetical protein
MTRLALPILALLAVPLAIRAGGDDLKAFRAKSDLAVQKLTQQVADAITLSRKLEKSDPIEAKSVLQATLSRVRESGDLSESQRSRLVSQLQGRLSDITEAVRRARAEQEAKAYSEKPRTPRPPVGADPRGGIDMIKDWQGTAKDALGAVRDNQRIREKNVVQLAMAQEKAIEIPTGDNIYVFPKNWKDKKPFGPKLTEKEIALLKALNSVMTPTFKDEKFRNVIDYIQEKTGLPIIIDEQSLKDAMIEYDDPVNFSLPAKVSVRTILKKVLGDKGLTYVIKEATIQVMTPRKASEYMVTRMYQVGDLVQPNPQLSMMYGPFFAQQAAFQNANQLINLIQTTIEPSYWQPNGPGTITYFPPAQSIIIRASAEMHYQMSSGVLGGGY